VAKQGSAQQMRMQFKYTLIKETDIKHLNIEVDKKKQYMQNTQNWKVIYIYMHLMVS